VNKVGLIRRLDKLEQTKSGHVRIENPIINSPFREPDKQFAFDEFGITNEIISGRRSSSYFIPIAGAKKSKNGQQVFDTEWTRDRIEENRFINSVREKVRAWRDGGYIGVTPVTLQLLKYWNNPEREKKLFFCQIEALETIIYTTEVAKSNGDNWIHSELENANNLSNPGLKRMALKMATGSGKTVVMAMLIAWHTLNKKAAPVDARFGDAFLVVTPGITIRDRLRVLLPSDDNNYYRERDIVPVQLYGELLQAEILITNFHTFQLRDKLKTGKLNKQILKTDGLEKSDEMVRRVCRALGNKKNLIILNDEAHHCYRRKPESTDIEDAISTDEKSEVKAREEEAKIWISGLEAVKQKLGIRVIYDLSATPFFLKGSGYPEGTLFPWVLSDFSLIDAIESGIVKVPRVPVSDDSGVGEQPTYRDLWIRIRESLPKKGRRTEQAGEEPVLPVELQGALHSLYGNYEKYFKWWEENPDASANGVTSPVFIVVCNNTNVSKMVFDYISGWEKDIEGQNFVQAGKLEAFRNDDGHGNWNRSPFTILVDSSQLESGDALSDEFKKVASKEIEEFKEEYSRRLGGRDAEGISDSEILREVMNTVGKPGKLGEKIRCVVSVSMLTEGWDANTVTHVLGVRAFSTQLLCEQVVGRALRRRSYVLNENGMFDAEYAEVYGVPFSFIPTSGSGTDVKPGNLPTRVRSIESRSHLRITFPHVLGYRYDFGTERLNSTFDEDSKLSISTIDVPTETENAPIVGERSIHTLDDLRNHRMNEVIFTIAKEVLEKFFKDEDGNSKPWLYPQIIAITRNWVDECLVLKDSTFPQMLLLTRLGRSASEKIYRSILSSVDGQRKIKPILRSFEVTGSTDYVDFDTTKNVYRTSEDKSPISHVVADTQSWEQKMASVLEEMPEVFSYVKNQNLGFTIPYVIEGDDRSYVPDFIVKIKSNEFGEHLNLVLEVSGEKRKDKAAKVETVRTLWVPAVNNHGGFGQWAFIEISDPWDAKNLIREFLKVVQQSKGVLENAN
jgi:type III restriction enzyme